MTCFLAFLLINVPQSVQPERLELDVAGVQREALVFRPRRQQQQPAPLVFVFHGHGGTMQSIARRFSIHELWPEALVVVPQGLKTPGKTDPEGVKPGWQKTVGDQGDRDLQFFDALLLRVRTQYAIDELRIYSTGHSNGGGFTYLLSQARPGTLAAIAPSAAGSGGFRGIRRPHPIPVLHSAGRRDRVVPFENQLRTIARLKSLNQCDAEGRRWAEDCLIYSSRTGNPIVTYIHGGTHRFPDHAPSLMVRFFQEHVRTMAHSGEQRDEAEAPRQPRPKRDADVVVYSATPAGIAAAIEAARGGAAVVVVEPTAHIGGMTTSGLSHPDFRTFEALTGFYLDFTERVYEWYSRKYGADSEPAVVSLRGTHAEPHVNELVLNAMLEDFPNISLITNATLLSVVAAAGDESGNLRSLRIRDSGVAVEINARFFVDASYDGDLMAMAGVDYTVGRESRDTYGESLAPEESDEQLQGYNFRFVATQNPELRVPVERPAAYQREEFTGILPLLTDGSIERVFGYPRRCVFKAQIPPLPRGKHDINDVSSAAVRLSMPAQNLAWPQGTVEQRQEIFDRHVRYSVGLLWFLQHDAEVPRQFREEALQWGWCRDEFTDHAHLPWQLYVRESRRMRGDYVFTQQDTEAAEDSDVRARWQADAVAMGDYGPNCHGTAHEGPVFGGRHTGEFYQRAAPYQIPRGVMLTRQCPNLLVPVACSSSHVGFCALRLEPIWSSIGQAAGTAVRLAVQRQVPVQDVTAAEIRKALHQQGAATIYVSDVPRSSELFTAVQWLGAAGGLHGLQSRTAEYGERGPHIIGQYYEAFPNHAFNGEQVISRDLWLRWRGLLPESMWQQAEDAFQGEVSVTRATAVMLLHRLVSRTNEAVATPR
jgi:poly(3-hydroxybutyrate) depolymerase